MRIKIKFTAPAVFHTHVLVRISDINYGGHVGNDSILSIIHEARLLFLKQWNYTEMNAGGCGLIMADSAIQYKAESFHGDNILVAVSIENISSISFDLFYKLIAIRQDKHVDIAYAKTGMVTFNYATKSIVPIPEDLLEKLTYA